MPSAASAAFDSRHTRAGSNLPPRGSLSHSAMAMMVMMFPSASSNPGITPAKKSRTTEVSVTMP